MINETPEKYTIIDDEKDQKKYPEFEDSHVLSSVFHRGPQKRSGLRLTGWLFMSVFVDHLMIIFNCCLFLLASSFSLKLMDPHFTVSQILGPFFMKSNLFSTIGCLYILVSLIYFVGFRVLMGATIGEWSCSIRVGQPYERLQSGYKMKVIARVFLILMTGVVTIPVLSLLFKKDIAGEITKTLLYTLK